MAKTKRASMAEQAEHYNRGFAQGKRKMEAEIERLRGQLRTLILSGSTYGGDALRGIDKGGDDAGLDRKATVPVVRDAGGVGHGGHSDDSSQSDLVAQGGDDADTEA